MKKESADGKMDLKQVDKIYRTICSYMSVRERISYCSQLIYRTHSQLSRYGNHLPKEAKSRSLEMLQYARRELHQLMQSKHP